MKKKNDKGSNQYYLKQKNIKKINETQSKQNWQTFRKPEKDK